MISRNADKGFLAAHWDWLVAGLGVMALVAAGGWTALVCGESPDEAASDAVAGLGGRKRAETGVAEVTMDSYALALKGLKNPGKVAEPAETQESFLASGRRVFCEQGDAAAEKKNCGKPIPFGLKVCPLCGAKQPEEEKIVLDSDGDGFPDEYEKAHGMNPQDPSDVNEDLDGDGFTNLEEFLAKTDPSDKSSHPDYLDSLKVTLPLKETILPFYFDSYVQIPSGYRFLFKPLNGKTSWVKGSTAVKVLIDEEIPDSGFVLKNFEKKTKKVAIKGSNVQKEVEASVATIVRKSDGKTLKLAVGEKNVSVDTQATLTYERNGTQQFVVVPGNEISLNGTKYKVTEIKRIGKGVKVTVKETLTEKIRTLEALEQ